MEKTVTIQASFFRSLKIRQAARYLAGTPGFSEWFSHKLNTPLNNETINDKHLSNLNIITGIVTAGVLEVWAQISTDVDGGYCAGMTLADIDLISEIPCLGVTMEAVGWVRPGKDATGTVIGLEFNTHACVTADGLENAKERKPLSVKERGRRFRAKRKAQEQLARTQQTASPVQMAL